MCENIQGNREELSYTEQIILSVLIENRISKLKEFQTQFKDEPEIAKMFRDDTWELEAINRKLGY